MPDRSARARRACILAIGTELTTGQITNRNAAWIAERLGDLGVEVVLHETVPDDRPLITQALDRCRETGALLFVTGGLGPTTDDFTRDVVAEWAGQKLRFDDASWEWILARLGRFGVKVAESNRRQCWFPESGDILPNDEGTAAGFALEAPGPQGACRVWVLPGPPREVATIWRTGVIEREVVARVPGAEKLKLLTWQCLGKSEAELGEITERALEGSGLLTGYRAHRPFVEVKVWCPEARVDAHAADLARLEAAIAPWVVTRQGEDLARLLVAALGRAVGAGGNEFRGVEIFDLATGGIIAERLGAALREPAFAAQAEAVTVATEWAQPRDPEATVAALLERSDGASLTLCLSGFDAEGRGAIGFRDGERVRQEALLAPFRGPALAGDAGDDATRLQREISDRNRRFAAELALKRWREWLLADVC